MLQNLKYFVQGSFEYWGILDFQIRKVQWVTSMQAHENLKNNEI